MSNLPGIFTARKNKRKFEPNFADMNIERPTRKAKPYTGKVYKTAGIPYKVSQPRRFWRIKSGLPADQYWKKRYWRRRITGRGDYNMNPAHNVGTRYGGLIGSKLGEYIGGTGQMLAQSIFGLGDYTVKKNVLSGRLPEMTNISGGGGTVIRFQEYLGDVITSATPGAFNINSSLINAANEKTFPFLSQIAANYEQFEMEGLVFEYRSTSADALNSTNTALGSVMMATQYDVADIPFTNKMEMLNYEFSTSVKPSESQLHMVECDPRQTTINELYTLTSETAPPFTDPRLYFLGRFSIATTGFQGASVNIGQLHCTYQVRLLKPKLYTRLAEGNNYALFLGNGYTDAEPLLSCEANIINDIPVTITGNVITFPEDQADKYYRIELYWANTNPVAIVYPAFGVSPGITYINTTISPFAGIGDTAMLLQGIHIAAGQKNPRIPVSAATLPSGAAANVRVRIMEVSSTSGAI